MTIPVERARAVLHTHKFLIELLSSQNTPKVPKLIRDRARSLLRHYPSLHDLKTVEDYWTDSFIQCPFATVDPMFGELKDK